MSYVCSIFAFFFLLVHLSQGEFIWIRLDLSVIHEYVDNISHFGLWVCFWQVRSCFGVLFDFLQFEKMYLIISNIFSNTITLVNFLLKVLSICSDGSFSSSQNLFIMRTIAVWYRSVISRALLLNYGLFGFVWCVTKISFISQEKFRLYWTHNCHFSWFSISQSISLKTYSFTL